MASSSPPLIVIGASAGGPAALATILQDLGSPFPGALVIVQHVDARFADDMAMWLSTQSPIPVRMAREGDRPVLGEALLAGSSDHLVFTGSSALGYVAEPRETHHRPSIDVFFESVCHHWRGTVVGVLLTGMGSDGAAGLRRLRDRGVPTIAQDCESSVVYGMPKAAAELDAASEILPLAAIGTRLVTLTRRASGAFGGMAYD
ncbi:MAG TPA: chemotaxis protein CheB [Gemmatimonadaceae bacterium]|nr:chemotaxis protein CheB [Gemmatimonadaceae bacterium]